jgi:hypothetical protein
MIIKQLSVFLENRPGHVLEVCQTLGKAGINILTLTLADTEEFGVLHLIVGDPDNAKQVLSGAGYTASMAEVIALEVDDRPGGLAAILEALAAHNINIEYMYAFTKSAGGKAIIVFCFDHAGAALTALEDSDIRMVGKVELYERAGAEQ